MPAPNVKLDLPHALRGARVYAVVAAVAAAVGTLMFARLYLDDLARGHDGSLVTRILEEATGIPEIFSLPLAP